MSHWYVTIPDDFLEPPRVYNLERADALFIWNSNELCARFSSAGAVEYTPTIYEGKDAEDELGRILQWLDGGPDPCADARATLSGDTQ